LGYFEAFGEVLRHFFLDVEGMLRGETLKGWVLPGAA